ncbi:MAG: glycerol-3-phosphate 1-O-acyltransferase [Alphaproteobacteria bacterium]|nr:glycerol-3-phosphate 1-O-acyltransferase [Alphaproteobacteria bacterium]
MLNEFLGTLIVSYALGSIPFGLIIAYLGGAGDLRKIGSGNIGATNMLRTGRKPLAALTLLLDCGKGALAVYLTQYAYGADFAPIAGLFAVLGHIFPVWLHFKGGKGVATTFGVLFTINPLLGATIIAIWLISFAFSHISSISALLSVGYSSIAAYLLDSYVTALLCLCLAGLLIFTHRANITRLLQGTEDSFNATTT